MLGLCLSDFFTFMKTTKGLIVMPYKYKDGCHQIKISQLQARTVNRGMELEYVKKNNNYKMEAKSINVN